MSRTITVTEREFQAVIRAYSHLEHLYDEDDEPDKEWNQDLKALERFFKKWYATGRGSR